MEDFEELLDLAAIFLFIDSSAYVGNRMNVAPSTLTVVIGVTFLADSCRSIFVTSADVRNCPHVAPAALAVVIYVACLAFSCFSIFIASADVRNCPHVAPAALAVIIYFACFAFGCLSIVCSSADVRDCKQAAPAALAVIISFTFFANSFAIFILFGLVWPAHRKTFVHYALESIAAIDVFYTGQTLRSAYLGFRSSIEAGDCDECI